MKEQIISVNIGDRPYRLAVGNEDEEQLFREARKLIDERIKQYANNFAYKDNQDLLAMVALQLAVDSLNYNNQVNYYRELKERLQNIDKTLTDILED